jgi:conjugal transfer pilus assembly protein TraD
MLVLGTTRVGKTRFLETLVTQDIHRGDVTIVFDPKGDGDLLKRMYAESLRANRPFFMFHLGHPKMSYRYNPIGSYSRITEVATRIANQLPGEGQSAAFKEFVWRFVNVISKTMEALGIRPTYEEIYKSASNIDGLASAYMMQWLDVHAVGWKNHFDNFTFDDKEVAQAKKQGRDPEAIRLASFMKENGYRDPLTDAIGTILANDRSYFEKLVSSLYPLLEKLTTGQISELISPDPTIDDPRPIFDWMGVIQTGAVVYVGLDSLSDYEVAAAVGNAMFSDLTSIAGQIYKNGTGYGESVTQQHKRKISIHADEFNELIGDEFIPLLNKAGGAGYQVTVYTQTWSDVEAKIGSAAKAGQIGGNLNTLVMLRVQNIETAQILIDKLPEVPIIISTALSGASDEADPDNWVDFSTQNEDRIAKETVPMISASDLVNLPKGQAFALIEGGQLYKIRMPLPAIEDDPHMPDNIHQIAQAMNRQRDARVDESGPLTIEGEVYGQQ